jgi:hypothetical protein
MKLRHALLLLLSTVAFAAHAQEKFKVSTLTFTRPAKWESLPAGGMRAAELRISDPQTKEAIEIAFFHFGPANGGGTEANVRRWLGLFKEQGPALKQSVTQVTTGRTPLTYVQAEGTYMKGAPLDPNKTPMPGYALVGAIIEAEGGHIFVRMTGSSAFVKTHLGDFKKMIEAPLK